MGELGLAWMGENRARQARRGERSQASVLRVKQGEVGGVGEVSGARRAGSSAVGRGEHNWTESTVGWPFFLYPSHVPMSPSDKNREAGTYSLSTSNSPIKSFQCTRLNLKLKELE
jgi:hypothetical protein